MTVDGFGFGTLTGESCLKSHHGSGVLGRDPRDSCRFWSPHVEKVCTVTQFRLGEGGGRGGDTIGGDIHTLRPQVLAPWRSVLDTSAVSSAQIQTQTKLGF